MEIAAPHPPGGWLRSSPIPERLRSSCEWRCPNRDRSRWISSTWRDAGCEVSFRDGKTYVRANLHVARHLSKGVVIGRRGQTLQRIVQASTDSTGRLLGRPVYIDLWVKVREGWPDNPKDLLEFGYVC